jgi:ubiquinone biosynthesis protein UbiJ
MADRARVSDSALPLQLAESLINRALELDPEFLESLEPLSGKLIALELSGTDLTISFSLDVDGVTFYRREEVDEILGQRAPDVGFRGSPAALLRMVGAMRRGEASFGDEVRLSGDLAALESLRDAFRRMNVDLEELLSRFVGDIAAHEMGRAARAFMSWGENMRQMLLADTGEYLVEELKVSPPKHQLEDFASEVDRLRDDVERIEKRIRRLRAARESSA